LICRTSSLADGVRIGRFTTLLQTALTPAASANSPAPKRPLRSWAWPVRAARRRPRPFLLLLVAGGMALVLVGCKVDPTVTVHVNADGSGVVSVHVALDPAAVSAAEADGGKLDERVRLSDLTAAGWTVSAWQRPPDGSASIELSKPFSKVSQVGGILREISGTTGPLRDFRATRSDGTFSTGYSLQGTVDLKDLSTGVQSDQQLVQSLTAQHVDVHAIDQQLLADLQQSFALRLVVELPGGKRVMVAPKAGSARSVDATSSVRNNDRMLYAIAAAGFLLLAVVVMLNGRRVKRRRRRRRVATRPTTAETA
jgi:hypothetical protein